MTTRRQMLLSVSAATAHAALAAACGSSEGDGALDLGASEDALCRRSTSDADGPFYLPGAPPRIALAAASEPGTKLVVAGRLLDTDCRTALAGLTIDLWQADAGGDYSMAGAAEDFRLRGKITTDAAGRFTATTIIPGRYADDVGRIRPAHIHAKVWDRGHLLLTTQLYFAGDPYLGRRDYCTVAGTCNSADAARIARLTRSGDAGTGVLQASYDLIVAP